MFDPTVSPAENEARALGAEVGAWMNDVSSERTARYYRALATGEDSAEARAIAERPVQKTFRNGAQASMNVKLMDAPEPIRRMLQAVQEITDTAKSAG